MHPLQPPYNLTNATLTITRTHRRINTRNG